MAASSVLERITDFSRVRLTPTGRRVGFFLGVLMAVLAYFAMPDIVPSEAAVEAGFDSPRAAAITLGLIMLMGVWWMLEVVPLAVTGLLPIVVLPLAGVNTVGGVTASYGNKVIFLFLGGFLLSAAMQRWNLHRQIALRVVLLFGTEPKRMVFGFMLATTLLGMWISNTATAIMMISIGASILGLLKRHGMNDPKLASSMMVGIAYASSISAFGTIIASPPNALLVGFLSENYGINIGFGEWMLVGVPLSLVFMVIGWFLVTHVTFKTTVKALPGGDDVIRKELARLGPMGRPQWRVVAVFAATIFGWVFLPFIWPGSPFTDEIVAMAASIALFVIPAQGPAQGSLLVWNDTKDVPWGILILFGGGLALASEIGASGLSDWLASKMQGLAHLPTPVLIVAVCVVTMLLTEFMSNTATAATLIPIAAAMGVSVGMGPLALALPVTFAASCAFMMPACTPPNAIAVGSGMVKPPELLNAGWRMSATGLVLLSLVCLFLAPLVFGY